MAAPGSEQAIVSITRWAGRDEWRELLDAIIEAHFGPVLGAADPPVEDLPDLLGQDFSALFACVLEDFVTCDFGPDQRNIIADYLKRRGFKERAPVKSYLRALRGSVMSVYQVVMTDQGDEPRLADLIRGGDPIRIDDGQATARLRPFDRIAARLLPINGKTYLSSGMLDLAAAEVPGLITEIDRGRRKFRRWIGREADRRGVALADLEVAVTLDDVLLGEFAPVFTHLWLSGRLRQAGLILSAAAPDPEPDATETVLSTRLAALGGKSPRQAARSRAGRRQLAQWLKYRDARAGQVADETDAAADLGWLWQALEIEHLR